MRTNKAFTLAEVMVVLTVIGVLTAILIPAAFHSTPNEEIVRFKKAYNSFGTVIRELITSEKYYLLGDLGVLPNGGAPAVGYFCNTFSDIINTKSVNCASAYTNTTHVQATTANLATAKGTFDTACSTAASSVGAQITATDDIIYFEASPGTTFGATNTSGVRLFGAAGINATSGLDENYKVLCIDIDGIGVGIAPFGMGVRNDGKIMTGARADQWLPLDIHADTPS